MGIPNQWVEEKTFAAWPMATAPVSTSDQYPRHRGPKRGRGLPLACLSVHDFFR
ncbi:hypothetical protein SAT01_04650 [Sinomonas atrocyanea]|nr:hypothetical protein SAT01_04650 [Sinomonas atrocyanea]GGG78701.1 hypothetical protein GCM10007172_34750 [Sinomonas atrocyanea]